MATEEAILFFCPRPFLFFFLHYLCKNLATGHCSQCPCMTHPVAKFIRKQKKQKKKKRNCCVAVLMAHFKTIFKNRNRKRPSPELFPPTFLIKASFVLLACKLGEDIQGSDAFFAEVSLSTLLKIYVLIQHASSNSNVF